MCMRPLPPERTVDAEDDSGPTMTMQREFYTKRAEQDAIFDIAPIVRSRTELDAARRRLAQKRNVERNNNAKLTKRSNAPEFNVASSSDAPVGEIEAARYVMEPERLDYMDRFNRALGEAFPAVAEACAVVYGCEGSAAREAWFNTFCGLDQQALAAASDEALGRKADAEQGISVFEPADEGDALVESKVTLPDELVDFAPLYKSYAAYCAGDAPVVSDDVAAVGQTAALGQRVLWRRLMDRCVGEEFGALSQADKAQLAALNEQLRTVKLFGARIGEAVKEAGQVARQGQLGVGETGRSQEVGPANPNARAPEPKSSA